MYVELLGSAGGGAAIVLGLGAIVRSVRAGHVPVVSEHTEHPELCGSHLNEHWCKFERGHKAEPHACSHCDLTWPQAEE